MPIDLEGEIAKAIWDERETRLPGFTSVPWSEGFPEAQELCLGTARAVLARIDALGLVVVEKRTGRTVSGYDEKLGHWTATVYDP